MKFSTQRNTRQHISSFFRKSFSPREGPHLKGYKVVHPFSKVKNLKIQQRRTILKIETVGRLRSASAIGKFEYLIEHQIEQGASVQRRLERICSIRGNKRIESVNRDFNAAIHIGRCVVLKT